MASLKMKVTADVTEFMRAIEKARDRCNEARYRYTVSFVTPHGETLPDSVTSLPLAIGAAAALTASPRPISRRGLLGLTWVRRGE